MELDAKKDAVTLRVERGAQWLVEHWQQVALGVGALIAAGAMGIFVVTNLKKLRTLAWEQLSTAQALAAQGKRAEALSTADQLLTSTRSGAIVGHVHLFKGDILLLEGRFDEAIASYDQAALQASSPELLALAEAGLATAHDQAQKWPEAEQRYAKFIKDRPEHFLTARAYEALGRIQMVQQKWPDAQATFERLVTLYPTTVWARNAQEYLGVVKFNLQKAAPK